MPTYAYECSSCEQSFEVHQRITESPLEVCRCGSAGTIRRVIQPIAVMFKGEGFHINDYAPKAAKEPESAPATECTGEPQSCPTCADPPTS